MQLDWVLQHSSRGLLHPTRRLARPLPRPFRSSHRAAAADSWAGPASAPRLCDGSDGVGVCRTPLCSVPICIAHPALCSFVCRLSSPSTPLTHPPTSAMNLDESLMNFVNVLGISIFGAIALFHYVQSAAKNQ